MVREMPASEQKGHSWGTSLVAAGDRDEREGGRLPVRAALLWCLSCLGRKDEAFCSMKSWPVLPVTEETSEKRLPELAFETMDARLPIPSRPTPPRIAWALARI